MRIKLVLIIALFTLGSLICFGQEHKSLFNAPDNWISEQFDFPLSFAPSINYTSYEDLRFAPGWSDTTSNELWTYTFVWYVEKNSKLSEQRLENELEMYFDGLMGVDYAEKSDTAGPQKTVCNFVGTKEGFQGSIQVYDAFSSKDEMTLNVKVSEAYCSEDKKQLILFQLSPRSFDDDTWEIFNDVKLTVDCD